MRVIFLDRFDVVSDLRGKNRTYENIKAAVLVAGKFSCFDIETEKDGIMFTELCNDPELEIDTVNFSYPWTGVRRRTSRALDGRKRGAKRKSLDGKGVSKAAHKPVTQTVRSLREEISYEIPTYIPSWK